MNLSIVRNCLVRDVPVGHHFMRGRWIFQVTDKKGKTITARKVKPIKLSYVVFGPEKCVDETDEVTHIYLRDYKVALDEGEIL